MCFWFFKSKEERDAERMKKEGKRLLRQKQKEEEKARKQREKEEKKNKNKEEIVEEKVQEPLETETDIVSADEPLLEEVATTEIDEVKKPRPANYHISLREDGRWQVKRAKGERAIKIFKTQAEAIDFAKARAENMDGSITIHKKDGKIRKQKY